MLAACSCPGGAVLADDATALRSPVSSLPLFDHARLHAVITAAIVNEDAVGNNLWPSMGACTQARVW